MASNRQIEANRKNAEECTGPRALGEAKRNPHKTPQKTGLNAKSEVLHFESRPEYEALIAAFHARFHPVIPEDLGLVDMLIHSEWLSRRYTAIDTAIWEHELFKSGATSLGATFPKTSGRPERVGRRIN